MEVPGDFTYEWGAGVKPNTAVLHWHTRALAECMSRASVMNQAHRARPWQLGLLPFVASLDSGCAIKLSDGAAIAADASP